VAEADAFQVTLIDLQPKLDEEINAYVLEMLWATGLLILWRKTYKVIAGYWPTAPGGRPFKGEMNGTPKLVFSRTLERVDWLKFRLSTASPRRSRA
jgi:dihydrofolate reductase